MVCLYEVYRLLPFATYSVMVLPSLHEQDCPHIDHSPLPLLMEYGGEAGIGSAPSRPYAADTSQRLVAPGYALRAAIAPVGLHIC